MDWYDVIRYTMLMTTAVPVFIGIVKFKWLPEIAQYLTILFLLYFIRDWTQFLWVKILAIRSTFWISNIHIMLELIVLFLLFRSANFRNSKLWKVVCIIFITATSFILYNTLNGDITDYKYYSYATSCLLIITCSLLYIFDFAFYSKIDIDRLPMALYIAGVLLFVYTIFIGLYIINKSAIPRADKRYIWLIRSAIYYIYMIYGVYLLHTATKELNE